MSPRLVMLAEGGGGRGAGVCTATAVAGRLALELDACFLENVDLLRVSRLPFARCFGPGVSGPRPLSADSLAAEWSAAAARVRAALADEAARCGLPWHFRVARADRLGVIQHALAAGHDVLIASDPRLRTTEHVVHVRWPGASQGPRALQFAARVAGRGGRVIAIVSSPIDVPTVAALAADLGVAVSVTLDRDDATFTSREGIVVSALDVSLLHVLADPAFALGPGRALVVTA